MSRVRWLGLAGGLLLLSSGCCWWADRWCPQHNCAPPSGYYPSQPCCPPCPPCGPAWTPANYPTSAPPARPGPSPCPCP